MKEQQLLGPATRHPQERGWSAVAVLISTAGGCSSGAAAAGSRNAAGTGAGQVRAQQSSAVAQLQLAVNVKVVGRRRSQAFDSRCRKPQCGSHRRVASVSSPNTQSRRAAPVGVVVVPGVMEQLQEAAVRWPWAHDGWQLWMVAVAFGRQSLQQHRRLATCDSSCAGSSSLAGLVMPGPLWQKHLCQCFAQPALS